MPTVIAEHAWIVGAALVGLVLVHALVSLSNSISRERREREQHRRETELLESRIARTRAARELSQQASITWTGHRKFRVDRKVDEGGDICSFELVPHDGKAIPSFFPGQYLTFLLDIAGREKPLVRCYSLSDAPRLDRYRVSIKRVPPPRDRPDLAPGISSSHFHDHVNEGDLLDVKSPRGDFTLNPQESTPIVLIGGGIGITPVLSMLNAVAESGISRETWFFYGVCNQRDHVFADHLRQIEAEHDHIHMHVCYSEAGDEDDLGHDYHHGEWVSVDLLSRVLPSSNYDFFICGPPPMMESLVGGLRKWGVPKPHIHFEAFGPATIKRAPKPDQKDEPTAASTVTFARSGETAVWDDACSSLLEFAEKRGIPIDSGCRAGSCGTCVTAMRSGEVTYLADPGIVPEAGCCLTCICIPNGNVELDA